MNISNLGDQLLLEIFSKLSYSDICLGVRLTSSHWKKLSEDYELWKVVDLTKGNTNKDKVTDYVFINLLKNSRLVHKISVLNCCKVSDKSFLYIADNCPELMSLNVAYTGITQNGLHKIIAKCSKLQHINILGCRKLTPSVLHQFTGLSKLHVRVDAFYTSMSSMDSANHNLQQLAKRCPDLKLLDVRNSTHLSDNTMMEFATKCPRLQCLKLDLCKSLSSLCIMQISQTLKHLQYVSLANCCIDDSVVRMLVESSEHLVHLNISSTVSRNLSDASLTSIATFCKKLQHLDIHSAEHLQSQSQESQDITDKGIIAVVTNCINLYHLNLNSCSQITDQSLLQLANNCKLLEYLDLGNCSLITQHGLNEVMQKCARLKFLNVQNCNMLQKITLSDRYNAVNISGTVGYINGTKCIQTTTRDDDPVLDQSSSDDEDSDSDEEIMEKHDKEEVSEKAYNKSCRECDPDDSGFGEMLCQRFQSCTQDGASDDDVTMTVDAPVATNDTDVKIEFKDTYSANHSQDWNTDCWQTQQAGFSTSAGPSSLFYEQVRSSPRCHFKTIHQIDYKAVSLPMQLQQLDLSHCPKIGDDSLVQIGNHCHHLKMIKLRELIQITDAGICHVIENSPYLEYIYMSGWQTGTLKVTDLTLLKLAKCCPMLKSVIIWGAPPAKYEVTQILRNCRKIKEFGVTVGYRCSLDKEDVVVMVDNYHTIVKCELHNEYYPGDAHRLVSKHQRRQNILVKMLPHSKV
ncbi:uncharacterized protein LOC102809201 [Saccoglossus kowalevskii]|uniref:Uncharacterized protein LOC102809201 n=1 Tax=Saccoglossus kowalevskii TaxID=10224 RepID=A0ABM0MTP6_SACKO|nr:PREDICTED: uncharacterized protein LOC102809201 [Saccoglossus kowalevskii]